MSSRSGRGTGSVAPPGPVLDKIQHWREQAEEYRVAAAHCRTVPARQGYERLAVTCDHMAEGLAERLKPEPPVET